MDLMIWIVTNVIINNKLILECGIVLKVIRSIIYIIDNRKYVRCMQIFYLFMIVKTL